MPTLSHPPQHIPIVILQVNFECFKGLMPNNQTDGAQRFQALLFLK